MSKKKNMLHLTDAEMVTAILGEMPKGGSVTLAVYKYYSAWGFAQLRKSQRFRVISNSEKVEIAYLGAAQFLNAIICGVYKPLDTASSKAFYWTIITRRATDALRKLKIEDQMEGEGKGGFARIVEVDEYLIPLDKDSEGRLYAWLDLQKILEIAEKELSDTCYFIIKESVVKDRLPENICKETGWTPNSFKSMKSACLRNLKNILGKHFESY